MENRTLVAAMSALSRTAAGDFGVDEMLGVLCEVAAAALPVDGVGVLGRTNGLNRFVQASGDEVAPVERLQELLQDGPAAAAIRQSAAVEVPDLAVTARWPGVRDLAAGLGIGAVAAVPLLSRGRGWGALDLYRREAGPWEPETLVGGQLLADLAVSYLVLAHDRDQARAAHRRLTHLATHDQLTGLPNRGLLFDRLDHAIVAAARRGTAVAVVFVDLDLFKTVNDTYGHRTGDLVLAAVADRLTSTLRGADTVARYAGDEFVLVCEDLEADSAAVGGGSPPETVGSRHPRTAVFEALTTRISRVLREPIRVDQHELEISASIGVSIATSGAVGAEELIAEADTAMYAAKQAGRGLARVHHHPLAGGAGYADQLQDDLFRALNQGQLHLHYQPIFTAATREIAAVEALLRWDRPGIGMLPAQAFVDVAVETGLITSIGRWVIDETCGQMASWRRNLGRRAPATAFVNLSARELGDASLPKVLAAALDANGLEPVDIGLEIVEDNLADPAIVKRLDDCHRAGHPLSVDDFGTGYSSLSRLMSLPVSMAKIDRSFVAGVPDDARSVRLIDGVVLVASRLDIEIVAEGVESAEQADHLTRAGCQLLQGHHLGRPQNAADLAMRFAS